MVRKSLTGERMVLDSFSIEPSLKARVIALAKSLSKDKAEIYRAAIRRYVDELQPEAAKPEEPQDVVTRAGAQGSIGGGIPGIHPPRS